MDTWVMLGFAPASPAATRGLRRVAECPSQHSIYVNRHDPCGQHRFPVQE